MLQQHNRDGTAERQAYRTLCATALLAYSSYAICRIPLLPLFAAELGATPPAIGVIVGASTVTGILLKLPAGAWSDVLGRRPLLVTGSLVFATLPFTYLGVTSLGLLAAVRVVHGAATAVFGPVAAASLSDIAPPGRRATWLSTYAAIQGAGQALGPLIAGYLIATTGYRSAFVAAGCLAAVTPLLAARWPHVPRTGERRLAQFAQGVREVSGHTPILLTSVAQAAQFLLHGALSAFLPLYARDTFGFTPTQLGWLFALQTATTLASRPAMGVMSDRVGRHTLIVAGLVVCSVAVWVIASASTAAALVAAVMTYALGVAVTSPAASALVTDLSKRAAYGAAHGVFGTIYDIGDALGPIAAGFLVAAVGYVHMFHSVAAVALLAALAFALCRRVIDRAE